MLSSDVVARLSSEIPRHTSAFSGNIAIASIVPSGTTALATANGHGAVDGQNVAITGAEAPVQIDTPTFLRVGTTATFDALQDHDFTLSQRDIANGGKTIVISGANEAEFNGTFTLVAVHNRRRLSINVADSGPALITGSALVENANGFIFNGIFTVSNVTVNTFEYTLPISYTIPAAGTPIAQINIRILSVLDIEQYLTDVYTKQEIGKDQLVVQLGDVSRSKNKNETSDASDSTTGEYHYTPKFVQQFAVYIIQNMMGLLGGSTARDKVESTYIPAIFKAVERYKFSSGFTYSQQKATCTGHGVFAFNEQKSKGKAIYIHEVTFEMIADIEKIADTAEHDSNVAMRDVGYTLDTNLGTGVLLADVDLDDVPIDNVTHLGAQVTHLGANVTYLQ